MSAVRLQVEHDAQIVAAKVAVTAAAAPPEPQIPLPAGANEFDAVGALLLAWAGSTHQGVSAALRTRGGALGGCSASALTTITDMDDQNAADLRVEEL
jgi:hypothetical protein